MRPGMLAKFDRRAQAGLNGGVDMDKATFGAGCFWGIEAIFRKLDGISATSVGYMGGNFDNPTYQDVCTGLTGHAEVVQVEYDPEKISYDRLLETFWDCHDPTQLNRQGPDFGTQYRSAIFFHDAAQEQAAEKSLAALRDSGRHRGAIVTEIVAAGPYTLAEDYHQQYFDKMGNRRMRLF
jgi:peptide-methionine (S)-S-oxide reductase